VRTRPDPTDANKREVCVVVERGGTHVGGKIVLSAAPGSISPDVGVDLTQAAAESCQPIGQRIDSGILVGQPYFIYVAPNPNGTNGAWVCAAWGGVYVRVRAAATTPVAFTFLPDQEQPVGYEDAPLTGLRSGTCKAAGGTRHVNLTVGAATPVALYTASPSPDQVDVCARVADKGGRLRVDRDAVPTVVTGTNRDSSCPFAMFDNGTLALYTPPVGSTTPPLGVCVSVGGMTARVTVDADEEGDLPADFAQDPA
jgi:hypothetical protein